MICEKPFVQGIRSYGCGKCLPCLSRRRGVWSHRIMLEAMQYADNAFVTLTYTDEELRKTEDGFATLDPVHLRNWLKRLRKSIEPRKVRYFAVGEYGDKSERPHYHVALFGHPTCLRGMTDLRNGPGTCCSVCSGVQKTWPYGAVHLGRIEMKSASYISGYVLKKMTNREDVRLGGRFPEFARMSLVPGIGASAMDDVASVMMEFGIENKVEDVPTALAHSGTNRPLGRYLRQQLRKRIGRDAKGIETEEQISQMLDVHARSVVSQVSVGKQSAMDAEGRIRSIHWRSENLGKRRVRL